MSWIEKAFESGLERRDQKLEETADFKNAEEERIEEHKRAVEAIWAYFQQRAGPNIQEVNTEVSKLEGFQGIGVEGPYRTTIKISDNIAKTNPLYKTTEHVSSTWDHSYGGSGHHGYSYKATRAFGWKLSFPHRHMTKDILLSLYLAEGEKPMLVIDKGIREFDELLPTLSKIIEDYSAGELFT